MKSAILAKNLSFTYPDGTRALDGIDLEVSAGEKVAIVGPNGAGKSTLLFALNGLVEAQGEIEIAGLKLERKNLTQIRARYGLVFQNPDDQLFCPTVFEDVAFGPSNMGLSSSDVEARANHALAAMDIEKYRNRSSHHLSVGEKKKVAIATALALEPEIFAFDEPLSNLDPKGIDDLLIIIDGLRQTVIVVTHDVFIAKRLCNRVVGLKGGRIVFDMPASEVLSHKDALTALFGTECVCSCKR